MDDLELPARCGLGWLSGVLSAGLVTASGIAAGATGAAILRSAGWNSVEFSMSHVVDASAVGSVILGSPVVLGSCIGGIVNPIVGIAGGGAVSVIYGAGMAVLALPAGAAILGYITEGAQTGFVFAAGAVGMAVIGSATGCCLGVLTCCGGGLAAVASNPIREVQAWVMSKTSANAPAQQASEKGVDLEKSEQAKPVVGVRPALEELEIDDLRPKGRRLA